MSLRRQQLTGPMLHVLRMDTVQVSVELVKDGSIDEDVWVKRRGFSGSTFIVQPNRFVNLRANLKNPTRMFFLAWSCIAVQLMFFIKDFP